MTKMYRIGVDVGGTNTDCSILDISQLNSPTRGVLITYKTPTTNDITSGVTTAIQEVLSASKVDKKHILSVTIGTTQFINAVVERDERRLSRVAVVRLCGPTTRNIPPLVDYPESLRRIVEGETYFLDGGLEIDGREIMPLNLKQIAETADDIVEQGLTKVAVVGVFSPLDHTGIQEEKCKELMLKQNSGLEIVCSHSIGSVGLLERENATILNAAILAVAKRAVHGFSKSMKKLELNCNFYLAQNDGTITTAAEAIKFPIKCFASGPTNSMTGAAFLAGLDKEQNPGDEDPQVLVVDIGGTTTDICALLPNGLPRQAPNYVEVGGVRTAFLMPETLSVGLGGGSIVKVDKEGKVTVGPESVGHDLTTKALIFGGDVMTATDIVVALGKANIGNPELVAGIPKEVLDGARKCFNRILQRAIEEMKVSASPATVLLVGGGSIVYIDEIRGVGKSTIPPHHDSANAVGAGIAKVAGEVDVIEILDGRDERQVVKEVEGMAIRDTIKKGADPADVKIMEVEKIPLQYVTNKATRIKVKAVGRLGASSAEMSLLGGIDSGWEWVEAEDETKFKSTKSDSVPEPLLDDSYKPDVRGGVWHLSELDLKFIASGTGVLGTGGGGPSYLAYLMSLDALRKGGKGSMQVVTHESLKDDDIVAFGSWYGAPSVSSERLAAGTEIPAGIDAVNKIQGIKDFQALLTNEIGGGNGLSTFPTSVHYGKPTVDGDMMGRAYPSSEHCLPFLYGEPVVPCALADAKGNVSVVMNVESNSKLETMLRATCIELGLSTSAVSRPLSGYKIKKYTIPNTISQSWYLGRAIHTARKTKTSFTDAIFNVMPGKVLFTGKVIDVTRDVSKGYTIGRCLLAPLSSDEMTPSTASAPESSRHLVIPFQNEFLYAAYTNESGQKDEEVLCTVPDLVSILGEDGEAIGSQELRYGLKVVVLGMPAHPLWTDNEKALKIGGPEYFGLDMEWKSIGKYEKPRSVIEEFNQ